MTINIALETNNCIILGCDSYSSVTEYAYFPFRSNSDYARDGNGEIIRDANGSFLVPCANLVAMPTSVMGGAKKMFCIYEDEESCVAAVTSGLATINGITISEHARRFYTKNKDNKTKYSSTLDVAHSFQAHMLSEWRLQFGAEPDGSRSELLLDFIIAGYCKNDAHGAVYKIGLHDNLLQPTFSCNPPSGITWAGQANYIERLLRGHDATLHEAINKSYISSLENQRKETIARINQTLKDNNFTLPEAISIQVDEDKPMQLPWDAGYADIDYGNMPTQYAIDLVEMLVNTQSGMQRFARGIPTVGGRTHIGVLTRGEPFRLLNPPELQHRHTGYGDDY